MKTEIKTAHSSFLRLLDAADLDDGERQNLLKLWDNVLKAIATGNARRIRKALNDLCRAINKILT